MLEQDTTEERKKRHKITQEDFTPESVVELMYSEFPDELYTNFSKTILDPCAGIGNLLLYCIKKRLGNCKSDNDVYSALSSVYGTELMEDNVNECHKRIIETIREYANAVKWEISYEKIQEILSKNIVCADTFKWDYDNWEPIKQKESVQLF